MKITATFTADGETRIRYSLDFIGHEPDIGKLDFLQDVICELTDLYNNLLSQPTIDKTP